MWPLRKKQKQIAPVDAAEKIVAITPEELEAHLNSRVQLWIEREIRERLRITRDQLELGTIQAGEAGPRQFSTQAEEDAYHRGECASLRWVLQGPRLVLKQNQKQKSAEQ